MKELLAAARTSDGGVPWLPGGDAATEPTALAHAAGLPCRPWLMSHAEGYARLLVPAILSEVPPQPESDVFLTHRGRTFEGLTDFDGTLQGWGWVHNTASWVTPTAMACLSLRRMSDPRLSTGITLLQDRRCLDGGWNYGNPRAYGEPLSAQPEPTAWAILALGDACNNAAGAVQSVADKPMGTGTLALLYLAAASIGITDAPLYGRLQTRLQQKGLPRRCDHLALVAMAIQRHSGPPCPLSGRS